MLLLSESCAVMNSPMLSETPPILSQQAHNKRQQYSQWPVLVEQLARELNVDPDMLRCHHVCELYASGLDKMAEEVLLTVNDHAHVGCQLLVISGQRLAHFMFHTDKPDAIDGITKCSPTVSSWLKGMVRTR